MNPRSEQKHRLIIRAAAVADGAGTFAAPGAILLEVDSSAPVCMQGGGSSLPQRQSGHVDNLTAGDCRIIAAGTPQSIGTVSDLARVVDLSDSIILPGLVNVHTHLDLSHIGPRPAPTSGGFAAWAEMIRSQRAAGDDEIRRSVQIGIDLALRGGTVAIGDIAGGRSLVPLETLRKSPIRGTSFLEVFGLGASQSRSLDLLRELVARIPPGIDDQRVALGVQPHAPYSCGVDLYRATSKLGLRLSTHLAETLEEVQFVREATGPLADMLQRLGVWDDSISGNGNHPIDVLAPVLECIPCIAAHLNYIEDRHLGMMSKWPISVGYCPRASAYFGHPQPGHAPHRYLEMMQAGINVALGTDSIVCLPPDQSERLSVLDEMRFLHHRDGTDPLTLLRMATVNGARALNLDERLVTLKPGDCAGLIAVPVKRHSGAATLSRMLS